MLPGKSQVFFPSLAEINNARWHPPITICSSILILLLQNRYISSLVFTLGGIVGRENRRVIIRASRALLLHDKRCGVGVHYLLHIPLPLAIHSHQPDAKYLKWLLLCFGRSGHWPQRRREDDEWASLLSRSTLFTKRCNKEKGGRRKYYELSFKGQREKNM